MTLQFALVRESRHGTRISQHLLPLFQTQDVTNPLQVFLRLPGKRPRLLVRIFKVRGVFDHRVLDRRMSLCGERSWRLDCFLGLFFTRQFSLAITIHREVPMSLHCAGGINSHSVLGTALSGSLSSRLG